MEVGIFVGAKMETKAVFKFLQLESEPDFLNMTPVLTFC